jgi:DNA-directed RNA polymerase subunit L
MSDNEDKNSFMLKYTEEGKIISDYIDNDPLVRSIREDFTSIDVLRETLVRLAEISSTIAYERKKAILMGENVSLIARREITALTSLRDATLRMVEQRMKQQEIDLNSPVFRNLLLYIVQAFKEAMSVSGIKHHEQSLVISALSKIVDKEEWKLLARKAMGV